MLSFDPLHSDFAEMNGMNPFKSIAVPRPICWVSTVSEDGIDNLAPYSQFSNVGFNPFLWPMPSKAPSSVNVPSGNASGKNGQSPAGGEKTLNSQIPRRFSVR